VTDSGTSRQEDKPDHEEKDPFQKIPLSGVCMGTVLLFILLPLLFDRRDNKNVMKKYSSANILSRAKLPPQDALIFCSQLMISI
jgi:hypothetical protein